ncbi:MAG: DUF885 domain-containing protein, partial [Planctomycetota bacterium]|nr:DUF885 domain-containing protein [Planctomycetota bacterium]
MPRTAFLLVLAWTPLAMAGPQQELRALMQEDYEESLRREPTSATARGDRRYDHLLPDASPAATKAWLEHSKARLARASRIERAKLTARRRVDLDLFVHELTRRLEGATFKPEQVPVTQMSGPQQWLPQLPANLTFTKDRHFADYAKRLESVPKYLDQVIAQMRAGLKAGRTPPRVTLPDAAQQALAHGLKEQAENPRLHAMWPPFSKEQEKGPLADRTANAIREHVVPAFEKFGVFLRDEYIPNCRTSIAASDSVDGRAWYDSRLKFHTTLPLTADAIHATGLAEVKRIRAEMMAVIARSDYENKDDFDGFVNFLRTDKRFYFTKKEDLLTGYRDVAKRIDAWMPRLFKTLPRLSYGVREMPNYIAAAAPTGYYYSGSLKAGKPGYFVANTFRLDQRPKYEMIPLTLHEAVPGHHHQGALAQEI